MSEQEVAMFSLNFAKAAIALFIVVDPFGNIPLFMSLTEKMTKEQRRDVFNTASLIGFILLLVFAFTGQELFNIFGIQLYAFEVAGGILLLIVSIRILISGGLHENVEVTRSVGAVPIAMPLLVGPGAITTTIFNFQAYGLLATVLSVLAVSVFTWIILRTINTIYRFLGVTGSLIITRVMALLIAAISIQYILDGLEQFIRIT